MTYTLRAGSSRDNFLSFPVKSLPVGYVLPEAYHLGDSPIKRNSLLITKRK